MNILLVAAVLCAVPLLFWYLARAKAAKEADTKAQAKARHEANEKAMAPQKALHEQEKKRWEDDYWKRQQTRS